MATKQSLKALTGAATKSVHAGLICETAVLSLTSSLSAGDVLQMIKVPSGATLVDLIVRYDGTTANTVTGAVGDGDDVDRYSASLSVSNQGLVRATLGVPYSYSADDTIDIQVGSVTSATIAGSVSLTIMYKVDSTVA